MSNNIREPFFSHGYAEVENISQQLSENVEIFQDYIVSLEEYEMKLGSKSDTRDMRRKMNDAKSKANATSKKIEELLRNLRDLQPKKADDRDYKLKVARRVQENFDKQSQKFIKLLRNIQTKEKTYLEVKKSMHESRHKSSNASAHSMASSDEDIEVAAQIQDLDFTEALLKEREKDLQDIRKLAHEVNLTAQFQAQKLAEASSDLEIIENDTGFTEKKTEEANRHLDQTLKNQNRTSKKNLIICLAVIFICALIIAIVVSNQS